MPQGELQTNGRYAAPVHDGRDAMYKFIAAASLATLAFAAARADCKHSVVSAWKCLSESCVFAYTPDGTAERLELTVEKASMVRSSAGHISVCRQFAGREVCDEPIKGRIYSDEYLSPHSGRAEYSWTRTRAGVVNLEAGLNACR